MITQDRLKELFSYDAETGHLIWKKTGKGRPKSLLAGTEAPNGYIVINVDYKRYMAHRLVWLYHSGVLPEKDIDHINNNRADNRIENLREATRSENMQNEKKARSTNKNGLLGVSKNNGRWRAQIELNYKRTHIGYFDTPEEAHAAYLAKKRELHPFQTIA